MASVLPRSVFFHIGRTGGHWVSHVLWKARLVERRLSPIHITPAQARVRFPEIEKPFAFCFVRHPLEWLASVWRHEVEHGWFDSDIKRRAAADDFSEFLRKMLSAWPDGPCSVQLRPFVSECNFVGRTENLAADLLEALRRGGETFDTAHLTTPRLKESTFACVRAAARAPLNLLEAVMAAEKEFNRAFGYGDIPDHLVAETLTIAGPWPLFPARLSAIGAPARIGEFLGIGLGNPQFEYHLSDGSTLPGSTTDVRLQWGMIDAAQRLDGLPARDRAAVLTSFDPYLAFLLKQLGFSEVTAVVAYPSGLARDLCELIDLDIRIIEYHDFSRNKEPANYDLVVLQDALAHLVFGEIDLAWAAHWLKPGGKLIAAAASFNSANALPTKVLSTDGLSGGCTVYRSADYLKLLCETLGLRDLAVSDSFDDVPNSEYEAGAWERGMAADPYTIRQKTVFSARKVEAEPQEAGVVEMLLARRPLDLRTLPRDELPADWRRAITRLEIDLKGEERCRAAAEQGLADREGELIALRKQVADKAISLDALRSEIRRLNALNDDLAERYRLLKAADPFLGTTDGGQTR